MFASGGPGPGGHGAAAGGITEGGPGPRVGCCAVRGALGQLGVFNVDVGDNAQLQAGRSGKQDPYPRVAAEQSVPEGVGAM